MHEREDNGITIHASQLHNGLIDFPAHRQRTESALEKITVFVRARISPAHQNRRQPIIRMLR